MTDAAADKTANTTDSDNTATTSVDLAADRARLLALIKEQAVVHGRVTLSSGREADYYVDLRRATLHHEAGPLIGQLLDTSLHIGPLALLYGVTMWLTTSMNPPAADPVQQKIFAFMPVIFTFMLGSFPAGLVIYWAWNNLLSILQQYIIMHRFGAENPIDSFIARVKSPKTKAA